MQMGLNTDITHQGKTLHVQTEDVAGAQRELITHVFLAGLIITSERRPYDEDSSAEQVRAQLRSQHQLMIRAVLSGRYDRALLLHRSRPATRDGQAIPLARSKTRASEGSSES